MKYSVVMPIFHRKGNEVVQTYAKECVESVKRNSQDYELIIIDDGSTLDTSWFKKNADVYKRHKNKGVAPSWNDGIKLSKGKYIVVINDDIVVPEGWLDDLVLTFEIIKNAGVVGPAVEHLPNGIGIEENHVWFPGSCFMLPRETIDKVGLFDEDFAPFYFEDTEYWTRILKSGLKMARNYNVFIKHKEGQTVKKLSQNEQYQINYQKFINKHGFDPIPVFCNGENYESYI